MGQEITAPAEIPSAYDARWKEIREHIRSTNTSEWKFAIVEADKLMDDALRSTGFIGDSIGEKMMGIRPEQLNSLDKLWRAHKIRNLLVHDTNFEIRRATVLEAIDGYESTLKELGAID